MAASPSTKITDEQLPFLMYAQNRNFLRDRTSKLYSPAERVNNLAKIIVAISFVLFCFLGWNTWRWHQFTSNGVITEAKVTERTIDRSGDSTNYYLTYEYKVHTADRPLEPLRNRERVRSGIYRRYGIGQYILVRYLEHDPASVTSKWHRWWIWQLGAGYGLTLLLCWLGLFRLPRYYRRRIQTFLAKGRIIAGRVLTSSGKDDDGHYQISIKYEFVAPTGAYQNSDSTENRNDLKKQVLPAAGTPVAVLYVSANDFFLL